MTFHLQRDNNAKEVTDLKIQYIAAEDGTSVFSVKGSGSAVFLPEEIAGLPVREICPYAFSNPEDAASHLPAGSKVQTAELGRGIPLGEEERFLGGPLLKEVRLPSGLRIVGEYAFYNCTALARITLGPGAARIGNGAFMNCRMLNEILFTASADAPTCLPGLLTEIQCETRVTFRTESDHSVWIFPEYYEESVENAPAHIFEHFYHGAGYRYRQCLQGDRLNAEDYDRQFTMAKAEAEPVTLLRIALARLHYPFRLSNAAEQQYRTYLIENISAAAQLLIADDDPEGLAFLASHGVFTRESISKAVEAASRKNRAECLSVLLNEQHNRFSPKEKTFDL